MPSRILCSHRETRQNIPDVELVDQDGKTVHLYSDLLKGRVAALSFIFTTCQVSGLGRGLHRGDLRHLRARDSLTEITLYKLASGCSLTLRGATLAAYRLPGSKVMVTVPQDGNSRDNSRRCQPVRRKQKMALRTARRLVVRGRRLVAPPAEPGQPRPKPRRSGRCRRIEC